MSIELMSRAWKVRCKTHTKKLVLMALADNSNDQGGCWPSVKHLAEKCDLTHQAILDQISLLEAAGMLQVNRSHGRVNRYTLTLPEQSTRLTSQPHLPVNEADHNQSTGLTRPVNGVDSNRNEPSNEPLNKKNVMRAFTDGWMKQYEENFGHRYAFQKAADGTAATRLLKIAPPEELLAIALAAWKAPDSPKFWNCRNRSSTLAGFASGINQIRVELKASVCTNDARARMDRGEDVDF